MFKQHSKKIIAASFLLMSIFMFTSPVFAKYSYTLREEGDTVMEYSDTKLSGTIYINATHYPQYYRGELEFSLQKKGLLGTYSNYGSKYRRTTYNSSHDIVDWKCKTKTMYRGFIELTKADSPTRYSSINGSLYLE